jgi:hypothetical protein
MTLKKKLLAIGFAAMLAMSVAACEVEDDPVAPEGSTNTIENAA